MVPTLTAQTRCEQVDHPLFVVGEAVGVELFGDGRVPGLAFLVLVQHPLQGGAVAEPVAPRRLGYAGQRGLAVQDDGSALLVGPQGCLACLSALNDSLQGPGFGGLEAEVQVQQFPAHSRPVSEVAVQRQARKLTEQVYGVLFAVLRVVEHGVGVGEDVLGGDGFVLLPAMLAR